MTQVSSSNPVLDRIRAVRGQAAAPSRGIAGRIRAIREATPKVATATPDVADPQRGFWGRVADTGNAFTIGMAQRIPGIVADLAMTAQAGEAASRNPARAVLPALGSAVDLAMNPAGRIAGTAPGVVGDAMRQATAGMAGRTPGLAAAVLSDVAGRTGAMAQGANAITQQAIPARASDSFSPEGIAYSAGQSMVDMGGSIAGGVVGSTFGPAGAMAGAFLPTLASEAGSNVRQSFEAIKAQNPGIADEDALTLAFVPSVAAAIPSAALDAASGGEAAVAREMLQTAARGKARQFLRRLGKGAMEVGRSALEEGLTEPIQGTLSDLGQKVAAPNGGELTPEDVRDFGRRRAAEALVGGVMGGVAAGGARVGGMFRDAGRNSVTRRVTESPEPSTPSVGEVAGENQKITPPPRTAVGAPVTAPSPTAQPDRLSELLTAIESEPDDAKAAALSRELDALVSGSPEGQAVAEVARPDEVAPQPPEVARPIIPPQDEVGGNRGVAGIKQRVEDNQISVVEGQPAGDVAGGVQAENRTPDTTRADYSKMTMPQLRREARKRGVSAKGTRAEVVKRLTTSSEAQPSTPSTSRSQIAAQPQIEIGSHSGGTPSEQGPRPRPETTSQEGSSSPNSTPREPWEMTREEFNGQLSEQARSTFGEFMHRNAVLEALARGESVPEHVVSEYPGIRQKANAARENAVRADAATAKNRAAMERAEQDIKDAPNREYQARVDENVRIINQRERYQRDEAWKKTKAEAITAKRGGAKELQEYEHAEAVRSAVEAGKPVPPEVLRDYPDLAAKAAPAPRQPVQEPAQKPREAKRARPVNAVVFEKPIKGKTGAELNSYEWRWKEEAYVDERTGEEVNRRESDWEESQTNEATGREIVHLFNIKRPDGTAHTVSLETALRELGYLSALEARPVRNIASSLKTLALNKMELARAESEWRPLEDARVKASEMRFPEDKIRMVLREPFSKGAAARGEKKVVWEVDGAEVTGETIEAGKQAPTRIPDERRMTLESEWRDMKAREIGGKEAGWFGKRSVLASKIRDLRNRIGKLEKKLAVSDAPQEPAPKAGGDVVGGVGQSLRPADGPAKPKAAVVATPSKQPKSGGRAPVKVRTFRTKEMIEAEKANRVHRPFSKADLEARIAEAYDSTPNAEAERAQQQIDDDNEDHSSGTGMFSFSGPLPGEVRHFIDGRPQYRTLFRANVKASDAHGEDYMAAPGDRYFKHAEELLAAKLPKKLEGLRNSNDPEHQFLAAVYDNMPDGKLPAKQAAKPGELPAGTRFEINGEKFEVMTDGDGYRVLKDGEDYPIVPVEMLSEIPVDKGTMKKRKARSLEPYKSEKVSKSARDLLGNEIAEPITGTQREMVLGHEGAKVDGPKREGVDAKIAEKFDESATDPLFDPVLDKLLKAEAAAKARIAARQIPRGKGKGRSGATTIPQDLIDHAHILAIRMARAGVKTFKAAMELVKKYAADEAPAMKGREAMLARRAFPIVRKATDAEGNVDLAKLDLAVAEDKGRALSTREMLGKMEEMARTLREGAKNRAETVSGLQKEFVRLARQNVPLPVRGKLLGAVANAKTYGTLASGIARARRVLIEHEARQALARVKKDTRRSSLGKLTNDLRKTIVGGTKATTKNARGLFETARLAYENVMDPNTPLADREASLRELQHVSDTIRAAIHQHRMENKVRQRDQWLDVRVLRAGVQAATRKAGTDLGINPDPREGKNEPGALTRFFRHLGDTETFSMMLDGDWEGNGPSRKLLYEDLRAAKTAQQETILRVMEQADALAKSIGGYENFGDFMAEVSGTLGKASQKTVKLAHELGGRKEITLGQAMKILAMDQQTQMQAARGRMFNWDNDRLADEFELTGTAFGDVRAAVPKKLVRMIDALKALRESLKPDMFRVALEINGVEPIDEGPNYEPRRTNSEKVKLEGFDTPTAETDRHLEDLGITKERKETASIPLLITDFGRDWIKSIEQMTAIIHLAHPLRTARMVYLNNPPGTTSTATAIANRFGTGAVERIKRHLRDVAGADSRSLDDIEKTSLTLTRNVSRALTALNPRSWVKNLGGIAKAMGEADAGVVARGVARMGRAGIFDDMMKHSAYLKHRYSLSSAQLALGMPTSVDTLASWKASGKAMAKDLKAGNIGDLFKKSMPALIDHIRISQWFDSMTARALWAGYELDPRGKGNPAWVAEQVERVMRRTQNSSDVMDISGLAEQYRRSAVGAPLLAFSSDPNRSFNMLVRGYKRGGKAGAKATAAVVANALFSSVVTGLMGQGVYALAASLGGDDKETEKRTDAAIADAAWQFAAELASPVFADRLVQMARGAVEGWSVKSGTDTPMGSQVALTFKGINGMASEIVKAYNATSQKKRDAAFKRMRDRFFDVMQGGANLLGIPGTGLVRQGVKAIDIATN